METARLSAGPSQRRQGAGWALGLRGLPGSARPACAPPPSPAAGPPRSGLGASRPYGPQKTAAGSLQDLGPGWGPPVTGDKRPGTRSPSKGEGRPGAGGAAGRTQEGAEGRRGRVTQTPGRGTRGHSLQPSCRSPGRARQAPRDGPRRSRLVSAGKGGLHARSCWELTLTQRLPQPLAGLPPGATFHASLVHSAATPGTSLVAQWLRLLAPNAGAHVRSLVRELDPTCSN